MNEVEETTMEQSQDVQQILPHINSKMVATYSGCGHLAVGNSTAHHSKMRYDRDTSSCNLHSSATVHYSLSSLSMLIRHSLRYRLHTSMACDISCIL